MNRRELFAALAAAALAPGELWVPKKRTFFLPPMGGWATATPAQILADINYVLDRVNARRKPMAMPSIINSMEDANWGAYLIDDGATRR